MFTLLLNDLRMAARKHADHIFSYQRREVTCARLELFYMKLPLPNYTSTSTLDDFKRYNYSTDTDNLWLKELEKEKNL